MSAEREVYIEGVALEIGWADARRSLGEFIFGTVSRAIEDAGRGLDGIDSVVLAAHDLVDGRSLSSMITGPAAGAYLRDEIRFGDDSAGAFVSGVTRIESGESERTIVAAWGRSSEHDVEAVSRSLFDPVFLGRLGLEELHISALNAQRWAIDGGSTAAGARARRGAAAARNPRGLKSGGRRSEPAYPLLAEDLPLWADVAAAVVISSRPSGVRLRGLGQSSEPYWPGDRGIGGAPALRRAADAAFREARLSAADIDLFELDGLTVYDEAIAVEAVGRAPRGEGWRVLAEDAACNPSGGSAAGYCAPAMGLTRLAEAALQLQGRAGAIQHGRPAVALASGSSIIAGQTQTVVILEAA